MSRFRTRRGSRTTRAAAAAARGPVGMISPPASASSLSKYAIVSANPLATLHFGRQPICVSAVVITGLRCFGSS